MFKGFANRMLLKSDKIELIETSFSLWLYGQLNLHVDILISVQCLLACVSKKTEWIISAKVKAWTHEGGTSCYKVPVATRMWKIIIRVVSPLGLAKRIRNFSTLRSYKKVHKHQRITDNIHQITRFLLLKLLIN